MEPSTPILGKKNNRHVAGKILTIRPAFVQNEPIVPVAWIAGFSLPPDGMAISGANLTNLDPYHLPFVARLITKTDIPQAD